MTKLAKTMKGLDAMAANSGDVPGFWQSASLLLCIWSSGGVPAAGYGPQVAPALFTAFQKLGSDFRKAVDARAFAV